MPDTCLGPVCEWVHLLSQWLKIHILPFGPLVTAAVAIVAGIVAIASILVTKKIARRRAAIDFFLKTEMDQSLLTLYETCQTHVGTINSSIAPNTKLEELLAMEGYGAVRTYLNIHELIAVGIHNKVFDERVCYLFWSAILVGHCKQAEALISFSRRDPDEAAAYWQLRKLNKKWSRKIARWHLRQQIWMRLLNRSPSPATDALPPAFPHTPLPSEQVVTLPAPPPGAAQSDQAADQNPTRPSPQTKDERRPSSKEPESLDP
jgi:hypothetical protein